MAESAACKCKAHPRTLVGVSFPHANFPLKSKKPDLLLPSKVTGHNIEKKEKKEKEEKECREACKEQIEEDYAQQLVEVRYKRINKYNGEHALAILEQEWKKEEEEDTRELQNMIAQYKIGYKEKLLEQDRKKRENDRRLTIQQDFIRRKPAIEVKVRSSTDDASERRDARGKNF